MARPKKKPISELLYFDGEVAIYDYALELFERSNEALKLLLDVDTDKPDIKRHIVPLIPFLGGLARDWSVDTRDARYADSADIETLNALGFKVENGIISPIDFRTLKDLRFITTLSRAQERAVTTAEYLQYLSKLYLLANGDRRQSSLIPDVKHDYDGLGVAFDMTLPWGFRYRLENTKFNTAANFETDGIRTIEERRSFSIPVKISYADIGKNPFASRDSFMHWFDDDFEEKKAIASILLASLLNYMSTMPFLVDESYSLMRRDDDSWAGTLADCMIQKKIIACPQCGRPVYKPRENSKPFCKQGHQTRYHEAAKRMLYKGESVESVFKKFPSIHRETIETWAANRRAGIL